MDCRAFLSALALLAAAPRMSRAASAFDQIEKDCGGMLGVAASDAYGHIIGEYRATHRFPLASVWKLPLVMLELARVDAGRDSLDRIIRFTASDLEPPFSTIARDHPHGGRLSIFKLCSRAISDSDNTAADLLAREVGGPQAVTKYIHSLGIVDIRVDRFERDLPQIMGASVGLDSTTPLGMLHLLHKLTNGVLSNESTWLLLTWMRAAQTGDRRLRAGVPRGSTVGDKTGSYFNAVNDVGVIDLPDGRRLLVACFVFNPKTYEGGEDAIAAVARQLS